MKTLQKVLNAIQLYPASFTLDLKPSLKNRAGGGGDLGGGWRTRPREFDEDPPSNPSPPPRVSCRVPSLPAGECGSRSAARACLATNESARVFFPAAPCRTRWWIGRCTISEMVVPIVHCDCGGEPASTATGFQARCRCATSPVSGVTPPWQGARGGGPPGGRAGRQGGPGHGPGGAAVQPHPGGGASRGGGVLALARAVRLAHEAGWVPGAPRPGPARDCTPPGAPPARRPGASRASRSPAGLPPPPVRARSPPPPFRRREDGAPADLDQRRRPVRPT